MAIIKIIFSPTQLPIKKRKKNHNLEETFSRTFKLFLSVSEFPLSSHFLPPPHTMLLWSTLFVYDMRVSGEDGGGLPVHYIYMVCVNVNALTL